MEYINFSSKIFQGFYESNLFNSDTLYYENEYLNAPDGYCVDIYDFNAFMDAVGECATKLLFTPSNIIKNMTFKRINSPRYYNFETDKLVIDVDCDIDLLKKYCFVDNSKKFNEYLQETFTSYDGFISFVDNNLHDFKMNFEDEKEKYLNVMIEFYLLETVDFEEYEYDLLEESKEILYEYLALEKDGVYYDYKIDSDDNVIVLDKRG